MDTTCVREVKALISEHLIFPIFIVSTIHLQVLHNKHKKGTIDKNLDFFFSQRKWEGRIWDASYKKGEK